MGLKMADTAATKRYVRGEDEDWIKGNPERGIDAHPECVGDDAWVEVRTALSKREDAQINDATVSERGLADDGRISLKPAKQSAADPLAFKLLVTGWSLGEPQVDQYEKLDAADAEWIDSCIRRSIEIARGRIEGNSTSPGTADQPSSSPASSDVEAGRE